jgi:hypothetical protein
VVRALRLLYTTPWAGRYDGISETQNRFRSAMAKHF